MEEKAVRPFGWRDELAYAIGDFGCNMSFALKSTLIIFWTQFMGMEAVKYAALLLAVQIWDAVNDPLIGAVMDLDRRKYRRGKLKAYVFAGSIGLIAGGAMCFVPVPNAPDMAKSIIFVAGYIIWDAFYTVANVPYGALLSMISGDAGDRASLSAWRSVGSLAANMAAMALIPALIYDSDNNIVGGRAFAAALVMGLIGFLAFQIMLCNITIRVEGASGDAPRANILKAAGNFLRSRPTMGATIAAMGMFLGTQGGNAAVTVLFQSYFQNVRISGVIAALSMLPVVFLTPFVRGLVKKFGKKELAVTGAAISAAAGALMLILPITPDENGVILYAACQFANSVGIGIYTAVSWALMGDAIDYNQWKFGARDEGAAYSLHSFFRKLAQGLGPSLVLAIMAALGYVEKNQGVQTARVAENMRYLVAAVYFCAAMIQLVGLGIVYNLDKKKLDEMHAAHGKASVGG